MKYHEKKPKVRHWVDFDKEPHSTAKKNFLQYAEWSRFEPNCSFKLYLKKPELAI